MLLTEKTRNELVSDSRRAKPEKDGKTRYQKRVKSRISASVREYNNLNMNKFFKEDILDINIQIYGETDKYIVTLSFGEILDNIKHLIKDSELTLRDIVRAIIISFNRDNVYIHCSCPDFKYRFNYWVTKKDLNSGTPEYIPAKETNPNDDLGDGCKHIMLVLANTSWIIKTARVIFNYINYMKKNKQKLYADIIYPAIYGKKYEEPVQLDIDSEDKLDTDSDTIDRSNKYAREKNQFQPGNKQGIRFAPKDNENQITIEDEIEEEE